MALSRVPRLAHCVVVPHQDASHVGGRLRGHYRQWRSLGNATVRRWVRRGVEFSWLDHPPAPRPAFDSADRIVDPVRWASTAATV